MKLIARESLSVRMDLGLSPEVFQRGQCVHLLLRWRAGFNEFDNKLDAGAFRQVRRFPAGLKTPFSKVAWINCGIFEVPIVAHIAHAGAKLRKLRNQSCRSASIGSSRDARNAGYKPKTMPTKIATDIDKMIGS